MAKLTVKKAMENFRTAWDFKRGLMQRQREDFEVALGKQWKDEDKADLDKKGIKAITVNVIRPMVNLITGLERQNRTDIRAFPEGREDSLDAEIVTRLLKNAMKQSDGDFKFSEMFEDGVICGESVLEPWIDNTFNLVNGRPRLRKLNFDQIVADPKSVEYDYEDAGYVCKITRGLTKDELMILFPENESQINKLEGGRIDLDSIPDDHLQGRDYPRESQSGTFTDEDITGDFDLVDYYYKKSVKRYYIADMATGQLQEFDDKVEAETVIESLRLQDPVNSARFRLIMRNVPEIWQMSFTGGMEKPLVDEKAWSYPKWKGYPFINYFGLFVTVPLSKKDRHLQIQGVVNGAKDSQFEVNKRKTQELHHLNSSANSGWLTPHNAWVDRDKVKKFGSSPGVNLEYKPEIGKPERISPSLLSQGHAQLVLDSKQDVKDGAGINADLLALQEGGQSSGRAIALRQRQGLVMVQRLFDNLSRSKKIAGRFLLSQLGEMFDLTSALNILGESFIQQHFPDIDPVTQQPSGKVDALAAQSKIQEIFNDLDLNKYDVTIGEVVASETMKMANFNELMEIARLAPGLVPPQILIDESSLQPSTKNRILEAIQQAQQQAQQQQQIQQQIALREATSAPDAASIAKNGNRGGL